MSSSKQPQVYFKKLNTAEKESKIYQLVNQKKSELTIWKKGSEKKIKLHPETFLKTKKQLEILDKVPSDYLDVPLLYSFDLAGLHFFGKTKITTQTNNKYYLHCEEDLFKSERRSNFRLLTYPHQDVYVHLKVINEEKTEESNVVGLKTGTSETGLFKNFLKIIGDDGEETETKIEGYGKYRVLDLSVTGLAVQFGEFENKLFSQLNKDLGLIYLEFNSEIVKIPGGQILYKQETLANDKKTKVYKAGMQFLNIDTNLDEKLASLINKTLRSLDSEFEDFLK
ncbi:MAG: hypothetical protein QF441_13930 [Bacteriovoracaceae bacterium]|jgi:hypothetical protein|nr:hypothetical protein [Halobacteriovoraceae bacterium]MDP7321706.1 hypothetical protein [Bacteriovoracaceae bacterium]